MKGRTPAIAKIDNLIVRSWQDENYIVPDLQKLGGCKEEASFLGKIFPIQKKFERQNFVTGIFSKQFFLVFTNF